MARPSWRIVELIVYLFMMRVSSVMALERRAVQSSATCIDTFSWMDNSLSQSPCIVAAYLLSACAGGNWNVSSIPDAAQHYTPPNGTLANVCSCSWAVYNTMQACADCQGQNFEDAMLTWSGWNGGCDTSELSDTYYPLGTPIPAETAIPFWATTDPTTWHDGKFDPSTAQSIANQDHSDITQDSRSSASSPKKSNTGAIVGGVIGGIVLILALLLLFYMLRIRRRRQRAGTSILKPGHRFSSVRFSPRAQNRGKYAGQTHYDVFGNGNLTTPSPGPTLPVSMTATGTSGMMNGGRPPYHPMPSSSSFISGNTMTATPPPFGGGGEYVTHTTPGKYGGYSIPMSMPMGMSTMNNPSSALSVSSAYATGAPSTSASAFVRNSHAHTLSGESAIYSSGSHESPLEGAIEPFVLPPVSFPEPMVGDGIGRTSTPGVSGKGGHGRGPSDSQATDTSSHELYTPATAPTAPPRATRERLNPPAYTPLSPPPPPGMSIPVPELEGGDEDEDEDGRSMEVQRAETTLSGTTLLQSSSGRGATTLAGDGDGDADLDASREEGGRGRRAYPVDRKG